MYSDLKVIVNTNQQNQLSVLLFDTKQKNNVNIYDAYKYFSGPFYNFFFFLILVQNLKKL